MTYDNASGLLYRISNLPVIQCYFSGLDWKSNFTTRSTSRETKCVHAKPIDRNSWNTASEFPTFGDFIQILQSTERKIRRVARPACNDQRKASIGMASTSNAATTVSLAPFVAYTYREFSAESLEQ